MRDLDLLAVQRVDRALAVRERPMPAAPGSRRHPLESAPRGEEKKKPQERKKKN